MSSFLVVIFSQRKGAFFSFLNRCCECYVFLICPDSSHPHFSFGGKDFMFVKLPPWYQPAPPLMPPIDLLPSHADSTTSLPNQTLQIPSTLGILLENLPTPPSFPTRQGRSPLPSIPGLWWACPKEITHTWNISGSGLLRNLLKPYPLEFLALSPVSQCLWPDPRW